MMRLLPLRLTCLLKVSHSSLRGMQPLILHARSVHSKRTKHISPTTTKKNEFENSIPKITHATHAPKPAKASSTASNDGIVDEETHHAVVSTFDLFSIGVGPSSSHTIGPMRASKIFINDLLEHNLLEKVDRLIVDLYGSLALTGIGHNTPSAILMGMEGETPEAVVTELITPRCEKIGATNRIRLNGTHEITFNPSKDIKFHPKPLPQHPNGMRFSVFEKGTGSLLATNDYFSVGGGFVVNDATRVAHGENAFYMAYDKEHAASSRKSQDVVATTAALPFTNCDNLIAICKQQNITIAQVVYQNELQWHSPEEIKRQLLAIWSVMDNSIRSGVMSSRSHLPGSLKVRRRAPELYRKLQENMWSITAGISRHSSLPSLPPSETTSTSVDAVPSSSNTASDASSVSSILPAPRTRRRLLLPALDYLSVYAIAVNEENAAGGRVVTAPTLGSAGVIPSVLLYYLEFISETPEADIMEFLLTSAAIGMLYKRGSSISASEMGCMGEVGVACSMAAAAFTAVLGGSVEQVERAAEIGMEHNLGLTCDPIAGLVQIPCIERNAIGAVKAVCAAQLALNGDGKGRVTLDQVIRTMRETGNEMSSKFKETSLGGLAVNVPAC